MLKRFLDWVIYGDCSQEPSDNIEFLKGLHPYPAARRENRVNFLFPAKDTDAVRKEYVDNQFGSKK